MNSFRLTRTLPKNATDAALRADVRHGLTSTPKTLPPKWFYDAYGSELFEKITELPGYHVARSERELLVAHADEIATVCGARTLVELGSGSSEKTRHLLDALPGLHTYIPVDVSESALRQAGQALIIERPNLTAHALIADFTNALTLPDTPGPRLVAFLGSTIGNFLPAERAVFLAAIRALLAPGDALLLGADLVKDPHSSSPPTTTRRPALSTRTSSRSSTGNSAPTSISTPSSTWSSGTQPSSTSGSRCGCARASSRP